MVSNKQDIIDSCKEESFTVNQIAYVLATVKHETAGTFKPVKEAYWLSEKWREENLVYFPYFGRGYVQITHEINYARFGKILNLNLLKNPDLALEHENAKFILIYGFKNGSFTGKKISDYINENRCDFVNARKCINGMDKAEQIAKLAINYKKELTECQKNLTSA